jgi:hypothetical protein
MRTPPPAPPRWLRQVTAPPPRLFALQARHGARTATLQLMNVEIRAAIDGPNKAAPTPTEKQPARTHSKICGAAAGKRSKTAAALFLGSTMGAPLDALDAGRRSRFRSRPVTARQTNKHALDMAGVDLFARGTRWMRFRRGAAQEETATGAEAKLFPGAAGRDQPRPFLCALSVSFLGQNTPRQLRIGAQNITVMPLKTFVRVRRMPPRRARPGLGISARVAASWRYAGFHHGGGSRGASAFEPLRRVQICEVSRLRNNPPRRQ